MSQKPEPPVITTQPINNHGALNSENHELIVHNGNDDSGTQQLSAITTQPTNKTEVLNSENHALIENTGNDTQLDPSAIPLEQQEELKQQAQERQVGCCVVIMDWIDICFDCIFPCYNGDCCNDNCCGDCGDCGDCCNDNCCGDCGNDDGGDGGGDLSCMDGCCGDDCCGD